MKLNLKVVSVLGIAAVVAVGGTFAYYTATDTFKNPFNTESFGTSSVEVFNPADGDNWEPGVKVDKAVFGMNEGDGDVYVRVFFEEEWTRTKEGDSEPTTLTKLDSFNPNFAPKESIQWDPDDSNLTDEQKQAGLTDGAIVENKESVVFKNLRNLVGTEDESGTLITKETPKKWYRGDDGWYYYTSALKSGETTELLLDGVQLAGDTDMGQYLDFAGFRKIPIADKEKPEKLAEYKPELVVEDNKLVPKVDRNLWYDMKEDDEGFYHIPTKTIPDANGTTEVPVDNADVPIPFVSGEDTFFSYEEHKLDPDRMGYADANYNLKITVEYIQADKDHAAVDSMTGEKKWIWYPGKEDVATSSTATP